MSQTDQKLKELQERQANLRRLSREAKKLTDGRGGTAGYEQKRDEAAKRSRSQSETGREIGPLPPVKNPERRAACEKSLQLYGETYFPRTVRWKLSPSHVEDINTLERCTLHGGLYAFARPRGEGKSTWAEIAALWATGYGIRRYVCIIAANDKPLAQNILDDLQFELEQNDLLLEDFPEICFPIRELEGIHQRSKGQLLNGERTRVGFTAEGIIYPRVNVDGKPSVCSGSVIEAVGMSAAIRGRKHFLPDGTAIRPDLILLDDPQTRASAASPTQTADRLSIIRGDILGLAGPEKPIAVVMPCTVIYPNDLADTLLDPIKSPQWQGRRTKRLLAFPKNLELWEREYREARATGLREGDLGAAGNEFYGKHRAEMDEGGIVSWVERIKEGELSALQGAMNHYLDDPAEFFAEDQNEPLALSATAGAKVLNAESIAGRLSNTDRYMIPADCTRITVGIDVHPYVLYYCVVAWNESFGGTIVDYGPWPRQNRPHFAHKDVRSLAELYPAMAEEQRVFAGLKALELETLGRTFYRVGGGEVHVNRCLVDSGYLGPTIYQYAQRSSFPTLLYPSVGRGRSATMASVSEWKKRDGERAGLFWRLTAGQYGRTKSVQFDTDFWKSHVHSLLTTPPGGKSGLWLYSLRQGEGHQMLAEHCAAEYATPATVRGTTFDKWQVLPHHPDNHLLDTIVLASVAASVDGLEWRASGEPAVPTDPRKRMTYAEQRAKLEARKREQQK